MEQNPSNTPFFIVIHSRSRKAGISAMIHILYTRKDSFIGSAPIINEQNGEIQLQTNMFILEYHG